MRQLVPAEKPEYSRALKQLTLEVVEDCNLRCKYCTYSGYYRGQRAYTKKEMTFDVARTAIDYFLQHSPDTDSPAITFYGGEPLIGLELIVKSCEWARTHTVKPVRFQLTTNGTLLKPRVLKQLMELEMFLVVSIDGPEECHDANRVTRGGAGSWASILDNLKWLRTHYPDYYRLHVGVNCVLAPNASPMQVCQFFESNSDLLCSNVLLVTMVSDRRTDYWRVNPPSATWRAELSSLRTRYYETLITGEGRVRFLDALFQRPFLKLQRRDVRPHLPLLLPLNASCIPGVRRLFVDCNGLYHMCERIHREFPVGSVHTGLNFGAIETLCARYREVAERHCSNCWLFRFCPKCFASAEIGDEHTFVSDCDALRADFSKTLEDYCRIAEINPFAFRFMEGITIA